MHRISGRTAWMETGVQRGWNVDPGLSRTDERETTEKRWNKFLILARESDEKEGGSVEARERDECFT